MTYRHMERASELDVTLATLDGATPLQPECHIWVAHKLPWVVLHDELPQFREWRER